MTTEATPAALRLSEGLGVTVWRADMTYLVRELAGAQLDQAVAMALGLEWIANALDGSLREGILVVDREAEVAKSFSPSSVWADGGPIIEREHIDLEFCDMEALDWTATHPKSRADGFPKCGHGETALIAATRALVRARLGDTVDL